MDTNPGCHQGQGTNTNTTGIIGDIDKGVDRQKVLKVPSQKNSLTPSRTMLGQDHVVSDKGAPEHNGTEFNLLANDGQNGLVSCDSAVDEPAVNTVIDNDNSTENGSELNAADQLVPCTSENNEVNKVFDIEENANRAADTKSPEQLMEEVKEEVAKLNISSELDSNDSQFVVNQQNESLRSLLAYDGDSDSDRESDMERKQKSNNTKSSEKTTNKNKAKRNWRKKDETVSGTSDSESDSSESTMSSDSDSENSDDSDDGDSASVIDASDDGIRTESPVSSQNNSKGAIKKQPVLTLDEYLPPVPNLSDLNIREEEEFIVVGRVTALIAELVTIEKTLDTPTLDLDSMLFIEDQTSKKPLGPIFDVLGPVSEPIYCIRFNNLEELKKSGVKQGMKVYAAPKSEEFSRYVFVKELLKMKATDASWMNDQELPADMGEFSDDELEREARRAKKGASKRKLEDNSLERHKRYEKTMNQCNTLNTRVCNLMDAQQNITRQIRPNPRRETPVSTTTTTNTPQQQQPPATLSPACLALPDVPPEFNPSVPPPGFLIPPSPYSYLSAEIANLPTQIFVPPPVYSALPSFNPQAIAPDGRPMFSVVAQPHLFGSFYPNQAPTPQNMGPPPVRWQRRSRQNPRTGQDNYFTNNGRNYKGPGPSSQPF